MLIVDLPDPSKIPALAKPWFLGFEADVEFHVVMTPDDLKKAGIACQPSQLPRGCVVHPLRGWPTNEVFVTGSDGTYFMNNHLYCIIRERSDES